MAADAYTEGNRVLGNTLLAQARLASDAVDETLTQLVVELSAKADNTSKQATEAAKAALNRAVIACIAIVLAGVYLTWRALRSILTPMTAISSAISGLIKGERDVVLPPEGQDDLGRMSQALRALRDSQEQRRALEEEAQAQRSTILTAIGPFPMGLHSLTTRTDFCWPMNGIGRCLPMWSKFWNPARLSRIFCVCRWSAGPSTPARSQPKTGSRTSSINTGRRTVAALKS